jgi:DNA-directed RNA polymerase specialized sigma24 family protein
MNQQDHPMTRERPSLAPDAAPSECLEFGYSDVRQLASRIARDDRLALCLLHEAYYPRLARLFSHLTTTREPGPIEHLIEETMLSVWLARESLDDVTSVYVWTMGIAFDHARQPLEIKSQLHEAVSHPPRAIRGADRDMGYVLDSGPQRWVYSLLGPLSVEERAVVHFVYTGHSCQDIADIMSLSCEQVHMLLSRASIYMRSAAASELRDRYAETSAVNSTLSG